MNEATKLPEDWTAKWNAMARVKPTALQLFDWAVVRQSTLGPSVTVCATAWGITAQEVRDIVATWNDTRGALECVKAGRYWRIDAYYNTSG